MTIKNITIFGYSETKRDDPLYQDVFQTAKLLAQAGYTIINGGGPGTMRAASEGAKAGDGMAIGVTFYPAGATHFEGRDLENPIDKEIVAANYVERTLTLIDMGDVFVIFKGGTGTISEFAMAWGLARLYYGNHKPMIFYGSFWHEILESLGRNMLLRKEELKVYHIIDSPKEVLEVVRKLGGQEG